MTSLEFKRLLARAKDPFFFSEVKVFLPKSMVSKLVKIQRNSNALQLKDKIISSGSFKIGNLKPENSEIKINDLVPGPNQLVSENDKISIWIFKAAEFKKRQQDQSAVKARPGKRAKNKGNNFG